MYLGIIRVCGQTASMMELDHVSIYVPAESVCALLFVCLKLSFLSPSNLGYIQTNIF